MTNTKDQMIWGNRTVATIGIRVIRDGKPTGDINGAIARAAKNGRSASQWVKPKAGRRIGKGAPSRTVTFTSFPLNSKVQAR